MGRFRVQILKTNTLGCVHDWKECDENLARGNDCQQHPLRTQIPWRKEVLYQLRPALRGYSRKEQDHCGPSEAGAAHREDTPRTIQTEVPELQQQGSRQRSHIPDRISPPVLLLLQ